jgi:hypothetical protein
MVMRFMFTDFRFGYSIRFVIYTFMIVGSCFCASEDGSALVGCSRCCQIRCTSSNHLDDSDVFHERLTKRSVRSRPESQAAEFSIVGLWQNDMEGQ